MCGVACCQGNEVFIQPLGACNQLCFNIERYIGFISCSVKNICFLEALVTVLSGCDSCSCEKQKEENVKEASLVN